MNKFEYKTDTHVVIKRNDALTLLTVGEQIQLANILEKIRLKRFTAGKNPKPEYYIVNKDEPYADKIFEEIRKGEEAKS